MSAATDQLQTRRALRVILVLAGKEVTGLRPGEIAKAISESASVITRLLAAMSEEGFTERVPGRDEAWRLGPKLVQISKAHTAGLIAAQRQIDEVTQRYSRAP